jgi:hypothetical protein
MWGSAVRCHPALDQGQSSGSLTSPAVTGLECMYRMIEFRSLSFRTQRIERFILPEWHSGASESRIRRARASTLDVHQSFVQRYQRLQEDVNVVGHYDPRVEFVEPPPGHAIDQDFADAFSHLDVLQP